MAVTFAELNLDRHEPLPSRFRTSPTPVEAITQLYADSPLSRFFLDASPSVFRPHVNRNIHAALISVITALDQTGIVGSIEGSMGAGKTTLIAHLAETFPNRTQIFRHSGDTARFATSNLTTQAETGGYDTGITAQDYHSATDLLESIRFTPGAIVLIDEWQFADPNNLQNLIDKARANMTLLIFGSLNTDFARRPWPNALLVKNYTDLFSIVLAARCSTEDCHSPALFTTRQVTLSDGRTRPAHTNESVVQVGSVADAYSPACARHHRVMRPDDARLFDAGHEPDDYVFPDGKAATTFWFRPGTRR